MTDFDPGANAPDGSGGRWLGIAGAFLAVFVKMLGRGKTRSGKPFVRFRGEIIGGQPEGQEGKLWNERVFINEEAWKRLGALCKAMGSTERFNLQDDRQVRQAMLGRPFKAKFKCRQGSDGNDYAEIAFSEHELTEEESTAIDLWIEEATASGFYDRMHEAGDWDDPQRGDDEAPPPTDDDIPF